MTVDKSIKPGGTGIIGQHRAVLAFAASAVVTVEVYEPETVALFASLPAP